MKFSIVVPAYNASCFLDACIASVKAQTYPQWELLAVNDGSTDDTLQKLKQYAQKDERIRVFDQENSGQFFARRRGIENATGDYVLFLDSDDELESDCLAVLAATLDETDHDMILYTGRSIVDGTATDRVFGDLGATAKRVDVQWLKESVIRCNELNSLCTKAFRRALLLDDDTDYTSFYGVHYAEDKVQALYPLTKAENIFYIPDRLYRYHFRSDSVIHQVKLERIPTALAGEAFQMLRLYMVQWGMNDEIHEQMLDLYQLRTYIEVYFNARKSCKTNSERKKLRQFPWKQHLDTEVIRHIPALKKQLTRKERLKLLVAQMRL